MSDQPGRESFEDDLGSYSLDDENQLQPEDTLDAGGDPLDEGYSPPDRQDRRTEWGTTPAEQAQDESIEQRIMQEEPDPDSAYGAPDDEGGLDASDDESDRVGGDDPDAIRAEDDFLGGEADLADADWSDESEQERFSGRGMLSPEEAAMRVED